MAWRQGWDFLALQPACLSAQTVITGWREKKIYWIYEGFDTWDTKRWFWLSSQQTTLISGTLKKLQLIIPDKFPGFCLLDKEGERKHGFFFFFLPMATAFFISLICHYHPVLISTYIQSYTSQNQTFNENKIRSQHHPITKINTVLWADFQLLCRIVRQFICFTPEPNLKYFRNKIRRVVQQFVFYKHSAWAQVVYWTWSPF